MLVATSALAQAPSGTILGSVKDAQGAVVPGATVTATNLGTQYSRSMVTDDAGEYALRLLPIGNYMLVVSIPGFKNFTQTGIVLEVGRNARVDATIELGAVSETVIVVGDSPLVETAVRISLENRRAERGAESSARQPRPVLAAEPHGRRHQQRERRTRWEGRSS